MPASSSSLPALLSQFQTRYPMGCVSAELLTIHQEQYVIRAVIQVGGITIATAMAADSKLETAEDRAKLRVLETVSASTSPAVFPPMLLPNPAMATSPTTQFSQLDRTNSVLGGRPGSQTDRSSEPAITPTGASQSQSDDQLDDQPDYSPTALSEPVLEPVLETVPGTETADLLPLPPAIEPSSIPSHLSPAMTVPSSLQTGTMQTGTIESTMPSSQPTWETEFQSVSQLNSTAIDQSAQISSVQTSPATSSLRTSKTERASKRLTSTELPADAPVEPVAPEPADRSEEIMRIGIEMKRLGWSTEQGREYLKRTYGKASRSKLDDAELLDFLHYLEMQSSPLQTPF